MVSAERIKTNHMLIDDLDMWGEFRINKSRDSTGTQKYYNIISEIIDQQLNAGKQWLNSTESKDYFFEEAKYQQGIFQSLEDEWEEILQNNYHHVDDLIEEVYNQGKLKGYNDIRRRLVFTDTDREALKFVRHYNFQLIRSLSNDLRANVKNTITKGIATGENPYNVANELLELGVTRLPGSTFTPKQRAVMIAKTEVSRAQNTGILQSYVNEGYTEVKILTAEDGHVCRLCLENAYEFNSDEIIYDNRGKDRVHRISDMNSLSWVPLHPNCRCTYTAVWESRRDNLKPEVINLTPLTEKDLMNSFFNSKSKYDLGPYSKNGQQIFINEKTLRKKLNGFVDKNDMDGVVNLIYKFKPQIHYGSIEYASAITKNGIINAFTNWNRNGVDMPSWLKKGGFNKDNPTLIHNHPDNTTPLPSPEDLVLYAECGIKYGIITNKFGTVFIKNNGLEKNKNNLKNLENCVLSIKKEILSDFHKSKKNWMDLKENNEDIYNKLLNDYAIKHNDKYVELYKSELKQYGMDVTFIRI